MGAFVAGDKVGVTIKVLIADDQLRVRDLFRFLLERAGDIQVVGVASDGQDAVEQAALLSPDVVLMDVSMPLMDGIEATRQIRASDPNAWILMISMYDDGNYIRGALEAGAAGYVLKNTAGEELVTAIRTVYNHDRYFSRRIAGFAQPFFPDPDEPGPTSAGESDL